MSFEGSRSTLRDLLASEEMRSALRAIEVESGNYDSVSGVTIGSEGWELKIAERAGMARGLLRAIDILNELTEDTDDG